jgi:tRNA dimethylallyltransferase
MTGDVHEASGAFDWSLPAEGVPGRPPLIVIVGPTAAGKTALSLELAAALDGEIVSADSRQVYLGMDIGTAKVTPAEQALVRHHLLDIVGPDQSLSVTEYQRLAYAAIDDILARGRLPFLVGGTGQYIHAVVEGWHVPAVAPQSELRASLQAAAEHQGLEALHARLAALDPLAATRIDYRNVRRVIRALEVCLTTGQLISDLQRKSPPPYRILQIGVTRPRPALYARIDARVDRMIADGLIAEVARLLAAGYGLDLPAMSGIGYGQIGRHLLGECTLTDAVALIKKQTRRFVHQQGVWFRANDPAIRWLPPDLVPVSDLCRWLSAWLSVPITPGLVGLAGAVGSP